MHGRTMLVMVVYELLLVVVLLFLLAARRRPVSHRNLQKGRVHSC